MWQSCAAHVMKWEIAINVTVSISCHKTAGKNELGRCPATPALPSLCWHHGETPSEHTQGAPLEAGCIPPVAPWVWKCVVGGWVEWKVYKKWVVVHVCMVGRWRVEGGTHSLPATPTSTISCYVYIKPYPHAITLNSYHSNQPYTPIVELVTRTIWILLSTVCRTQTEANNLWCESHDFICLETWTDDNLKHCLL